jgi:hypothetical protein
MKDWVMNFLVGSVMIFLLLAMGILAVIARLHQRYDQRRINKALGYPKRPKWVRDYDWC